MVASLDPQVWRFGTQRNAYSTPIMLSVAKFQSYRAALICWIISQFLTPLKKIVGGAPIFSGVKASKTQTFYSVCKNFGVQQPLGAEIWYSEKKTILEYNSTSKSLWLLDQVHKTFFTQRGRQCCRASRFQILDIFIRSRDIHAQIRKVSEIVPNLACFFCPKNFLGGRPSNFWTDIWTCFRTCGKISRRST